MPDLKHPLRAGGRWLRQATVLGLGAGLAAGAGLIVTASAASAHPDAAKTSASHGPARACALIVGRRGQVRVRPGRCRPVMAIAAPCHLRFQPAAGRTVTLRPVRGGPVRIRLAHPPRPPRLGRALRRPIRARAQAPVAIGLGRCAAPPTLSIRPGQVKLCGPRHLGMSRLPVAIRPGRLRGPVQIRLGRHRLPVAVRVGRVKLLAPIRACAVAVPAPPKPRG